MNISSPLCIWSEVGIAGYKLCPLHLDCESCEFHRQMLSEREADHIVEASDDVRSVDISLMQPGDGMFHPGCQYYKGHTWIRKNSYDSYFLGIDSWLKGLLVSANQLVLPMTDVKVQAGECFAWVMLPRSIFYICTPISGVVKTANKDAIRYWASDEHEFAVENDYLIELNVQSEDFDSSKLLTKQEFLENLERDFASSVELIRDEYSLDQNGTLQNGGPIKAIDKRIELPMKVFTKLIEHISVGHRLI